MAERIRKVPGGPILPPLSSYAALKTETLNCDLSGWTEGSDYCDPPAMDCCRVIVRYHLEWTFQASPHTSHLTPHTSHLTSRIHGGEEIMDKTIYLSVYHYHYHYHNNFHHACKPGVCQSSDIEERHAVLIIMFLLQYNDHYRTGLELSLIHI